MTGGLVHQGVEGEMVEEDPKRGKKGHDLFG